MQLYPSKVVTQVDSGGHNDVLLQLLSEKNCVKNSDKLLNIK